MGLYRKRMGMVLLDDLSDPIGRWKILHRWQRFGHTLCGKTYNYRTVIRYIKTSDEYDDLEDDLFIIFCDWCFDDVGESPDERRQLEEYEERVRLSTPPDEIWQHSRKW